MIQHICPYCDQVISNSLYCKNCRSRLRPGQAQKIDFYLNQRHPGEETGCVYHTQADINAGTQAEMQKDTRTLKVPKKAQKSIPEQKTKKRQNKTGMFSGIVMLIVWISVINGLLESCGR